MSTHKRWAEKMMRPEGPAVTALERGGAERERRRIRRAQIDAVMRLLYRFPYDTHGPKPTIHDLLTRIDAATRAPRRRK